MHNVKILFFLFFLFFFIPSVCFGAVPKLFFSDMTDGPTDGWEGSGTKGAAVSIWGLDFGSAVHTSYVTCAGQVLYADESGIAEWAATTNPTTARGLQRITFYLNSSMSAGAQTISVTTANGTSETIPFYTRTTGNIYFVDLEGSDDNDGLSTATPWLTWEKAHNVAVAGDMVYGREGVYTAIDSLYDEGPNHNWDDAVITLRTTTTTSNHNNGTENNSITFASYPGEVAQLGDGTDTNDEDGHPTKAHQAIFRHSNGSIDYLQYWNFSKFKGDCYDYVLYWSNTNLAQESYVRFVGWDMRTRHAATGVGMEVMMNNSKDHVYLYGNYMHHSGKALDTDPHGYKVEPIYIAGWGTLSDIHIGWNEMSNNNGTLQVYGHVNTDTIDNLYIHDNFIFNSGTTGIVVGGGDGASAYSFIQDAWIYNNIIANCISSAMKVGDGSTGSHGGNFNIFNNTFINNDIAGTTGDIYSPGYPTSVSWINNIFYAGNSLVYFSPSGGDYSDHTGSNNLFYGNGNGVAFLTTDVVNDDPELDGSYIPASTSPAIGAGFDLSATFTTDYLGAENVWDIGAINATKSVTLTGTAVTGGVTEDEIVTGGQTIIFTVSNDEFIATLCADNAATTAFMASCTSNKAEAGGWDAQMVLAYTDCTRDSATQATWVLPATAGYTISENEVITCEPPADIFVGAEAITASPTMTISNIIIPEVVHASGGYSSAGSEWKHSSTGVNVQ